MLKATFFSLGILLTLSCVSQDLDYPDSYKSLILPQYTEATIVDLGRHNKSLSDGLKIYLKSPSDYSALRAYYEHELSILGWELEESIAVQKMRKKDMLDQIPFGGVFHKGDLTYKIFTSRVGDTTKINITVLEN